MGYSIWVIRLVFIALCTLAGYATSQLQPDLVTRPIFGVMIGFGFAGFMVALDEMLKGFSLRAFSSATFGLLLGTAVAWMVDRSQLFIYVEEEPVLWLIRLSLFSGFGYIGMVLAMRSNKEDFSLIIPYVRFVRQDEAENILILDTSVIIDGRIADLLEANFLEGMVVVPRFVLRELQQVADSTDPVKRDRGRRGLDVLSRLQRNRKIEVKIHEGDISTETDVDGKLLRLARSLKGKMITNDYNLSRIAEVQSVDYLNLNELIKVLKPVILPGDMLNLRIVREGKDKDQGVGYLNDGTMVVVNNGNELIGQQVDVEVVNLLQTGAGVIVFAERPRSKAA